MEKERLKVNDLVGFKSPSGEDLKAKISWIDGEDCGLIFTAPSYYAGNATIDKLENLILIQPALGSELKDMTDEELRQAILNLRNFRRARPVKKVKASKLKKPKVCKESLPQETLDNFEQLLELQRKLDAQQKKGDK